MTLLQLEYVLALSEYNSFSKAARKLEISQPALSLQVNKLEEEIGMVLFKRTPTSVLPTLEGEQFIERARELLLKAEELRDLPFELENKPRGILRIGVIPTLAPYWLPLFMGDFAKTYPDIKLTIRELKTEDVIAEIRAGHLDAGLISTPIEAKGMVFTPLFYEEFFLYVSDKHELYVHDSIDIEGVDLKEMWYLQEGNCFQNQVDSVCIYAREPSEFQNVIYLSNSIDSLAKVVEMSGGITFIPELSTLSVDPDKEDMIKAISGNPPVREISLVTSKISKSDRLIKLFLKMALAVIPSRMKNHPNVKTLDTQLKL